MAKILFHVSGMSCAHCVKAVKDAVEAVGGVARADVDLESGSASVEYDAGAASPDQFKAAIEGEGFGVSGL